jgi:hypothetical protein
LGQVFASAGTVGGLTLSESSISATTNFLETANAMQASCKLQSFVTIKEITLASISGPGTSVIEFNDVPKLTAEENTNNIYY